MSAAIAYLVAFATLVVTWRLAVRRYFKTNESAGYVFIAIHWVLVGLAAALFVLLIKSLGG